MPSSSLTFYDLPFFCSIFYYFHIPSSSLVKLPICCITSAFSIFLKSNYLSQIFSSQHGHCQFSWSCSPFFLLLVDDISPVNDCCCFPVFVLMCLCDIAAFLESLYVHMSTCSSKALDGCWKCLLLSSGKRVPVVCTRAWGLWRSHVQEGRTIFSPVTCCNRPLHCCDLIFKIHFWTWKLVPVFHTSDGLKKSNFTILSFSQPILDPVLQQ